MLCLSHLPERPARFLARYSAEASPQVAPSAATPNRELVFLQRPGVNIRSAPSGNASVLGTALRAPSSQLQAGRGTGSRSRTPAGRAGSIPNFWRPTSLCKTDGSDWKELAADGLFPWSCEFRKASASGWTWKLAEAWVSPAREVPVEFRPEPYPVPRAATGARLNDHQEVDGRSLYRRRGGTMKRTVRGVV